MRSRQVRAGDYRRRFGLPPEYVSPVFAHRAPVREPPSSVSNRRTRSVGASPVLTAPPVALVVYEPGLTRLGRVFARLGSSRMPLAGSPVLPISPKAVVWVGAGATSGLILAQPFDGLTFLAPLYGLVAGTVVAGGGWLAVRGRGSATIVVDEWRPQLEAIGEVLRNADRLGQPFVSPPALRAALHAALWTAIRAVGEPGEAQIVQALDDQLRALVVATETALVELESPAIEARKAAVSEHLAALVEEIALPTTSPGLGRSDGWAGGGQSWSLRHEGARQPPVDRA